MASKALLRQLTFTYLSSRKNSENEDYLAQCIPLSDSICVLRIQDYNLTDAHIILIIDRLKNLRRLDLCNGMITATAWNDLHRLRYLTLFIVSMSIKSSVEPVLTFVSRLGPKNAGLVLKIGRDSFEAEEEARLQHALEETVGGSLRVGSDTE